MAFKMKGHPLKRGLYMDAKSPYPKVMDQGKLGNQLKSFQNDLRNAKDDETKRKIRLDIQSTMEEMQNKGMSMDQIKNIGGKSPFEKEGAAELTGGKLAEETGGLQERAKPAHLLRELKDVVVQRSAAGKEFDKAFAEARKAGKETFTWRGKSYNTKLA